MEIADKLCKIPEFIEFKYFPEKELHAQIEIQNLQDQIVTFKIKTNTPDLYLVKPMEGQIYNKEKMKIVFKRKRISEQVYESSIRGQKTKDKFLFSLVCTSRNAIDLVKSREEKEYMGVKFCDPKVSPNRLNNSKSPQKMTPNQTSSQLFKTVMPQRFQQLRKKLEANRAKLKELQTDYELQKEQLDRLTIDTRTLSHHENPKRQKVESTRAQLTVQNVICLVVLAILLGILL